MPPASSHTRCVLFHRAIPLRSPRAILSRFALRMAGLRLIFQREKSWDKSLDKSNNRRDLSQEKSRQPPPHLGHLLLLYLYPPHTFPTSPFPALEVDLG